MIAAPEELRTRLVTWYRGVARDLPWRRAPTPYHVLLSELMLQQTRVETVIPYFERFVARWPTLEALAAAEEQEVMHAWAGLGYYRRARSLLAAARAARDMGGLPRGAEALEALPGVGPYTAGAISAIAFGEVSAAVDGNVERVLSRVDGREEDPTSTPGKRALRERAKALSAPGVASEVVQGLMELGATVCTPRSPSCGRCPWSGLCAAQASGDPERLPIRPARKAPVAIRGAAGLLWRGGLLLMGRRPEGLLGGLWEPVSVELSADEDGVVALERGFRRRTGLVVRVTGALGSVMHVFTHRRLELGVYTVEGDGRLVSDGSYDELAWVDGARPEVPLSRLTEKVLELARQPRLLAAAPPGRYKA